MKKNLFPLFILTVFTAAQSGIQAATDGPTPLYQMTVVQTPAKAINYRDLKGSVDIDFKGTVLLPDAKGEADVRNEAGVTEIKAEFEKLTAAGQFGPEYLTYILWAISPDGRATNLGELIVKDGKSALNAKTPLQALSLLVTAEPYFAVSQPSNVVVLENAIKPGNKAKIALIDAQYELLPRGEYTKNLGVTDKQAQVMDKKTPFDVYQARNAVLIAKGAGAEDYAADGFSKATALLAIAETKKGGEKGRSMTAREAVQSAEDSRSIAVKRQTEEAYAREHRETRHQINSAKRDAAVAAEGQAKAEQAQGQSEIERSAALALAADASVSAANAHEDAKTAQAQTEKMKGQRDASIDREQKAQDEKGVLRAELWHQLNAVLQTQDTARGLIVNMSDALFQTGSAELQAPVREKLAKIAGIVSSHPGLKLSVEGHTDAVGGDEMNQRLSEKRAEAAKDYLVVQGVPADSVVSKGFGKTVPLESNDTPQGRQKNRRVEVVVSGDAIGTAAQAR